MADSNRGVVYTGPGQVEVQDLDYPKFELDEQDHRPLQHGVILKVVATNICGSDQHMVRGRTTAPQGQTLGHEITGEVAEVGRDVEFIKQGDLVSVPFNIACDMNPQRLQQAASFGCETIDLSQHDNVAEQIEQIVGIPEVDAAVDCVG